jgi:hypothetical protein
MMSKSTGQPRICRIDAGTDRITDPFDRVSKPLKSSTTEPDNAADDFANDTQSANKRFAASSPADTTNTKIPARDVASCNDTFANVRDLPTCRPAATHRKRAFDRANSNW